MKKIIITVLGALMFSYVIGQCLPVSNNMTLLDSWDSSVSTRNYSDVWGYVAPDASEYAIIGEYDSIYILDVSDPSNITLAANLDQEDGSSWRDFKVFGNYLYSIVDQGVNVTNGVVIYDLSALPTVTKVT